MLPEAIAALFTSKGPVLRLFVLIYFKLGEAVGDMATVPLASMGREEGGALFYVDFFFLLLFALFPSAPFGALGVSVISPFGPLDCLCLLILTCK